MLSNISRDLCNKRYQKSFDLIMSSEGNFLFIQLTSHQSIIFSMEHVFPIHIQRIGVDILINLES